MLATAYTLKKPEQVAKLILASPCLSSQAWVNDCKKLAESLSTELYQTMIKHETENTTNAPEYEKAVTQFYNNFFCRLEWSGDLQKSMESVNKNIYVSMWGAYEMTATGNLKDVNLVPELHKLLMPTLIISGQYDMATPETMQLYTRAIEHGEHVILSDCAHVLSFEKPKELVEHLRKFLEKTIDN
jgi:proline-specific peptidase